MDAFAPLKGDSLSHEAQWKTAFASLKGKPAQLEFQLRDADLFSIELAG